MPTVAMVFGAVLTILGVVAYTSPEVLGTGEPYKVSALSPAYLGVPIALCGLVSLLLPHLRKHAMHFAAMLGLFGVVGGFVPVTLRSFAIETAAVKVGLLMTVISAAFVTLCVKSFINARKARERREAAV